MRDLFFKEPKRIINKLTDDNWKEYLLEIWDKTSKNLEKFCIVAPDGLSREIRKRADNTVIALITLPKPQFKSEAYFIALVYRPSEKNFSSEQKVITRYLLLEYSVPRGYSNLDTALKEWTEEGEHNNKGYGCEPTLEAFYEAVCNILDEPTRNSSYNTGEIKMSKKRRKSKNIESNDEGLLENEKMKKFLKKYLKDPEIDYICSLRKKLDKKIPGLTEAFNKKSRYFIYWKGTDKDRTYMYVQKKKLRIDLLISRNFEEEILQEDEDFEVHHKNNFQGQAGWLTGWYVPYSKKNINIVVKYILKAFEGNP